MYTENVPKKFQQKYKKVFVVILNIKFVPEKEIIKVIIKKIYNYYYCFKLVKKSFFLDYNSLKKIQF